MIRNRPSSVVRLLTAGWGGAWLGEGRRQRRRLAGGQDLPCHPTTHRGELPPFDLCLASPAGLPGAFVLSFLCARSPCCPPEATFSTLCSHFDYSKAGT